MTPMLGCKVTTADLDDLSYPIIAQTKFDGIRCFVDAEGRARTRTNKLIPNYFIRKSIEEQCKPLMDGEIIIPNLTFNDISGVVRRDESFEERNFEFVIFDWYVSNLSYYSRYTMLKDEFEKEIGDNEHFSLVHNYICKDADAIKRRFRIAVERGQEGLILRSPHSYYKFGRSTKKEEALLKLKFESSSEAIIQRVHEEMDKEGNPKGRLGALEVISDIYGKFKMGSGFTGQQRRDLWDYRSDLLGMKVVFTYQQEGMRDRDKPRFPVFQRFI